MAELGPAYVLSSCAKKLLSNFLKSQSYDLDDGGANCANNSAPVMFLVSLAFIVIFWFFVDKNLMLEHKAFIVIKNPHRYVVLAVLFQSVK